MTTYRSPPVSEGLFSLNGSASRDSHSTTTMLTTGIVPGRKPKVCEEDIRSVFVTQNVEGFQVAMVDVVRMATIRSIDHLEEGGPDARRIAGVRSTIVDHILDATPKAIIEEKASVITELDVLMKGDDVGAVGEEVIVGALLFPTGKFVRGRRWRRLVGDTVTTSPHQLPCQLKALTWPEFESQR